MSTNSDRWQQIEAVLQAALDRPQRERAAYLDEICEEDDALRREALSLVKAYENAGEFIEQSAIEHDAAVLALELPDRHLGRVIGSYKINERLGSGGMGAVYLAQDLRLNRQVALKILPEYLIAGDGLRRFQREARAISSLNHPNILTIHEVGEAEGLYFIATEYIEGRTLRELISRGELSIREILEVCLQVGAGLAAAHDAGVIHRDIKPENIMRRSDGLIKVLDFGIAKLSIQTQLSSESARKTTETEIGMVLGTVGYMSPEQARGLQVDHRSDIWSFGVLLYEMLAGRSPFEASTRMDTLVGIIEHKPQLLFDQEAPEALRRLQKILDRSLSKQVEQRYQRTDEMLEDLKGLQQEFQFDTVLNRRVVPLTPLSPGTSSSNAGTSYWSRYQRQLLLGLASVTLITTLLFFLFSRTPPFTRNAASNIPSAEHAKLYKDMNETEQLRFIAAQEERISAMMGERTGTLQPEAVRAIKIKLDNYLSRLNSSSSKLGRDNLNVVFDRAVPYVPLIARSFEERKVPALIGIYLPMIESEYRPCTENAFGSKGLFQFLPQTAKQYGVSEEEMCDPEKMAPAAADYIADRMAELGEDSQSMTLVLLSYNRGSEWVRNTLVELRSTENFKRNFWTFFANRDRLDDTFRNENASYVPLFFAAAIIGENPQAFELNIAPLSTLTGTESAAKRATVK
jgi:serine/threonine protein kinase